MTPRWPLHPQPGPLEALSSWLARIAGLYHLPVAELLNGNLDLVDLTVPDDLDLDPPAAMLAALAGRTGVDLARIGAMTLPAGAPGCWTPSTPRTSRPRSTITSAPSRCC